jgi:DNA-directed RNA polymerase specialized sigma24 family protein
MPTTTFAAKWDSDSPDDEVVIAASIADPGRFRALFDRHFDAVYRHVAVTVGPQAAEGVASETFARAFRARSAFATHSGTARAWLYGIATDVVREWYLPTAVRRRSRAGERFWL